MKRFMLGLMAAALLVVVPGCGKKESKAKAEPVKPMNTMKQKDAAPEAAAKETKAEAVKAVEKTETAVKAEAPKAEAAVKATTSAFDKLVADAQALITDKKYADALAKLQAGLTQPGIDAAQKSTLQKLIDQAKAALAGGAAKDAEKKAGDLLKGVGGK